jgi:peptide/nickel transport system ATP-binding protein/oligopeptide transport system ATP-binding protein
MEEGDMQDIMERPLHPYTEGLINCVKSLKAEDERLYTMGGMSKNITDYTDSCPFYERCSRKTDGCRIRIPDMLTLENGRKVRCINIENNG